MELKSLSHTHTQLLVDALTTLGLLRCYGLEFGSPKVGTAGSGVSSLVPRGLNFSGGKNLRISIPISSPWR
ncbi:hypothetical protein ACOMHN_058477 [Nucella lapillus]